MCRCFSNALRDTTPAFFFPKYLWQSEQYATCVDNAFSLTCMLCLVSRWFTIASEEPRYWLQLVQVGILFCLVFPLYRSAVYVRYFTYCCLLRLWEPVETELLKEGGVLVNQLLSTTTVESRTTLMRRHSRDASCFSSRISAYYIFIE